MMFGLVAYSLMDSWAGRLAARVGGRLQRISEFISEFRGFRDWQKNRSED